MGEPQLLGRIARPVCVTERAITLDAQMDRADAPRNACGLA